jgi:hypothetical protein
VCIFVREDQSFNKSDTFLHCAEQTLEVCATELETKSSNLRILALYRAPAANFNQFIGRLDATLIYLYNSKSEFLICGDINADYLNDNNQKKQLDSLLTTYNLSHTVQFATRTQNDSGTIIDNISVDITRLSSSSTCPMINDLSDHDVQFLTVNITPAINIIHLKQRTREINNERIMQFQLQLANDTWESVYIDNGTNNKSNSFLHIFLSIFEASFPVKYKSIHKNKNGWITQGIKISCECKRRLYIYSRDSNDAVIEVFYIKYWKILNSSTGG